MKKFSFSFSVILIFLVATFLCACQSSANKEDVAGSTLKDYNGKTIIAFISQEFDSYVESAIENPNIIWVENREDAVLNLMQGRADAIVTSIPNYKFYSALDENISYIKEPLGQAKTPVIFSNNKHTGELIRNFNTFISELERDGTIKTIADLWFDAPDSSTKIDFGSLNENATPIRIAIDPEDAPFAFIDEDGDPSGFETDLMVRFCQRYDYYPDFVVGNKFGNITDAQNGNVDVCLADYTGKENSDSNLSFSNPILTEDIVLIVSTKEESEKFLIRVSDSIHKTILDDDRYLTYLDGLLVTLEITFPSILFGTIFGFFLYYLNVTRKKPLLFLIACLCLLKERVPDLVLLMIFYYVIFSNARFNAILIAIVAFAYMFAITTYRNLSDCASKVHPSQYMAAKSLGYTGFETFKLIILPQILPELLDRFKGDFVTHMLETSIVGLLAVTDLTGAANHIRSITYHTFAPLLIVSALYFAISSIIFFLINLLAKRSDPVNRRNKKYKGSNSSTNS